MEKLCEKFIGFFVSNNIIKDEDKELYEYAVNILLSAIIHILTLIILGLCFNLIFEGLLFYLSFIIIRKFAGGYHAKTPLRCFVFSVITSVLILGLIKLTLLYDYAVVEYGMVFLGLICVIVICVLSPLDTENNVLGEKEKKVFRIIAIGCSLVIFALSVLLLFVKQDRFALSLICGIYMSTFVLVMRKIQLLKSDES